LGKRGCRPHPKEGLPKEKRKKDSDIRARPCEKERGGGKGRGNLKKTKKQANGQALLTKFASKKTSVGPEGRVGEENGAPSEIFCLNQHRTHQKKGGPEGRGRGLNREGGTKKELGRS